MEEIRLRGSGGDAEEEANNRFIVKHWRQLTRREGLRRAPWFADAQRGKIGTVDAHGRAVEPVFYECDRYDTTTRQCTAYDERPPVCDGYPYYGGPKRTDGALPPACEFLRDRGEQPVPVEVMLQRRDGSVIT